MFLIMFINIRSQLISYFDFSNKKIQKRLFASQISTTGNLKQIKQPRYYLYFNRIKGIVFSVFLAAHG